MSQVTRSLFLISFISLASSGVSAEEAYSLDGFYGQVGIGMSSATPSFNNNNLNVDGLGRAPYTPGNINTSNSFSGTATLGYNFAVKDGFEFGVGAEYSPITGHGTNFTLMSPFLGDSFTRSGTVKLQNNYNLFISPRIAVSDDAWLYTKLGFTGAQAQLDSTTKNMNGYSLGLGYKQYLADGWYGFGEANYFNYGSQSFNSSSSFYGYPYTFSGNVALSSYNLLVGVGYQFGGNTATKASRLTPQYGEDGSGLETKTENELGLTVSTYKYSEQSLGVRVQSTLVGVDYTGTYVLNPDLFTRLDARYANGTANYSGSGTDSGEPNWYYDIRGLFGTDFKVSNFVLAPYTGIGYRNLVNNVSGSSSTDGSIAYQRQSTYLYIPVGVIHRLALDSKSKLETTAEFDYLIQGKQVSNLSSLNGYYGGALNYPNVTNTQNTGFGLRLSAMYQQGNWSAGPYFNYWNIAQSTMAYPTYTFLGNQYKDAVYEPSNVTTEIGFKVSIKF